MFKHKISISLLVLGLTFSILLFFSWVSLKEQKLIAYDVNSYGPDGLKAAYQLLQKSGYTLKTIHILPLDHQQMIILITTELSTKQEKELLDWVEAGGTIMELNPSQPSLRVNEHPLTRLTTTANQAFTSNSANRTFDDLIYHLQKTQVMAMVQPVQGFYGVSPHYFIYRQSYGAGNLITWNDVDGLTNRYLKRYPDNAVVLASLIRAFCPSSQVSFYNLAFMTSTPKTSWRTGTLLNHYWGGSLLFGIALFLLIWKLAARFGRPRPLILAQGRSYDEFVYSMASLFQQAKIQQMVLDNLWCDLVRMISELTHLPMTTPPNQLINRLNLLTGQHYEPILELNYSLSQHQKNIPKQQFLMIAVKLDAYRKELLEWKKSNQFVNK
jgi:hypothetical protein